MKNTTTLKQDIRSNDLGAASRCIGRYDECSGRVGDKGDGVAGGHEDLGGRCEAGRVEGLRRGVLQATTVSLRSVIDNQSTYVTRQNLLPRYSIRASLFPAESGVDRRKDRQSSCIGYVQAGQGIQRLGVVQGGRIERKTGRGSVGRCFGQGGEYLRESSGGGENLTGRDQRGSN